MFLNTQLPRYAAFLPLLLSCVCHAQVIGHGELAELPHAGERPAPVSTRITADASLRQALREPRLKIAARAQRDAVDGGSARPSPPPPPFQGAWKRGVAELALEGYTAVIIQCQKQQSPAATIALMRADSQQAHCFRF